MTVYAGIYVKEMHLYEGESFNLQGIDPSKRQKVNIIENSGLKRCLGFVAGAWLERQVVNMTHSGRKILVDVELPIHGTIRKVSFSENENHALKPLYIMFNKPQKLTVIPADSTQKVKLSETSSRMLGKIRGNILEIQVGKNRKLGYRIVVEIELPVRIKAKRLNRENVLQL